MVLFHDHWVTEYPRVSLVNQAHLFQMKKAKVKMPSFQWEVLKLGHHLKTRIKNWNKKLGLHGVSAAFFRSTNS